jgi:hypothetical protein
MEIIRIFDTHNQGLYSVKYPGQDLDEFDRLFDLWEDLEFLEDFFNTNKTDLQSGFYGYISIGDAIMQTLEDANALRKQLLQVKDSNENASISLNNIFKPLDNITYKPDDYEKSKAYGVIDKTWIRIYALKVDDNCFVITGGAIKLTKKMAQRTHTLKELEKLNMCRDYLRQEGIIDSDGLKQN